MQITTIKSGAHDVWQEPGARAAQGANAEPETACTSHHSPACRSSGPRGRVQDMQQKPEKAVLRCWEHEEPSRHARQWVARLAHLKLMDLPPFTTFVTLDT